MPNSQIRCTIREVSRILAEEESLEAVAIDEDREMISIATLGPDKNGRLANRISEMLSKTGKTCSGVDGVCSSCGNRLSEILVNGRVVIKQVFGNTLIEKNTCSTAISLWRWCHMKWPKYAPRTHRPFEADDQEWKFMSGLAIGCLLAGIVGIFVEHIFGNRSLALAFYLLAYLCGGWDAAKDTWRHLCKKELDIHFLMLAVAIGAAVIGAWREGALLLFLFSASGAMEHYAMGRTKREIRALFRGSPKSAQVLTEQGEVEIPVEELRPGMRLLLRPGDLIPVDMEVTSGESACDESNLTGEARPVSKEPGNVALAGTLNLWGTLQGKVLRPASESALQKIIRLIREAQGMRAPAQRFTDRFGTGYTWGILILCTGMFLVWWLVFRLPPFLSTEHTSSAFYRAMTLLVVASPCALVLSVPSAILSAIATGARRGILFRGGTAIETLSNVKTVALDKTGTLTSGSLALVAIEMLEGTAKDDTNAIAKTLANLSQHPVARAICKALPSTKLLETKELTFLPGQGIRSKIGEHTYYLGSRALINSIRSLKDTRYQPTGSEVWLAGPGMLARFVLQEEIRTESKRTLTELHAMGLRTVMLTGDRQESAQQIGKTLGVQEIRAHLLPEQKVAAVEELKQDGTRRVAMIGDGVNDAPCIAAADVGVAMGARGSDAALEQAEIILMNDRLEQFVLAYQLSRKSKQVIYQNVSIALGTVFFMVVAAFLFPIPLALGVAAHEGSTLLVVLNSLRLLRTKPVS